MVSNHFLPGAHLSPGAFALVAMGAVFAAASRATFTFIIFAFEITRDYNSVLPLMLVSVIADGIAMLLMPNSSIMTEKLARRGLRVHQDYETDVLSQARVAETMEKELPAVAAGTTVGALAERIAQHDPAVARHEALLILDDAGKTCRHHYPRRPAPRFRQRFFRNHDGSSKRAARGWWSPIPTNYSPKPPPKCSATISDVCPCRPRRPPQLSAISAAAALWPPAYAASRTNMSANPDGSPRKAGLEQYGSLLRSVLLGRSKASVGKARRHRTFRTRLRRFPCHTGCHVADRKASIFAAFEIVEDRKVPVAALRCGG